jgi:lysophospholipase L1-like esterase
VTRANCLQRSPLLGQEFRPSCNGTLASTAFRTNALGLRGGAVRDDGAKRILALGDSCTWGSGVAETDAYPAVLQRDLDEGSRPPGYQVINAGIPGYTVHQGLLYAREHWLALHPDIVIIAFGFNDAARLGDIETLLASSRARLSLLRLDDVLADWSVFYRWQRAKRYEPLAPEDEPRLTADKYERELEELVRLVIARGAKPVLLVFAGPSGRAPYVAAEQRVAQTLKVPLLEYQGPRLDIVNPTADGYRWIAATLAERLYAEGYVR